MTYVAPPIRSHRETAKALSRAADGESLESATQQLRGADGHLKAGTRIDLAGVLFEVTRARQGGTEADGNAVTFGTAYPGVPAAEVFGSQGIAYEPEDGSGNFGPTNRQYAVMKPDELDNQGFTVAAEIQDRGASTATTDSFPAGTLGSQGEFLSLAGVEETDTDTSGGSGLSATASDATYTTRWSVDLSVTDSGSGTEPTSSSLSVTVAVDKWDSDDGQWQEAGTATYNLTAVGGGTDTLQKGDSLDFTDSGVVSGDDVRVRAKSVTVNYGDEGCSHSVSVDPTEVACDSSPVVAQSMSPNGEELKWVARQEN